MMLVDINFKAFYKTIRMTYIPIEDYSTVLN
jgi:hypothetical protein